MAALVQRYASEIAPANVVHGWEKYILTDGENCVLVGKDHSPNPGEAVFDVRKRNAQIVVELHRHESMQTKRPMNLTISEEVRGMLASSSERTGLSMSAIVELAVKAWMKGE